MAATGKAADSGLVRDALARAAARIEAIPRPVQVRARLGGETDDTAALQEAMNDAYEVVVPAGRTLTVSKSASSSGHVSMLRQTHGNHLRGEDRATSIIRVANGTGVFGAIILPDPIFNTRCDNTRLSNLTFDMNGVNNPVTGEASFPKSTGTDGNPVGSGRKVLELNAGDGLSVDGCVFRDVQSKWLVTAASSKVSNAQIINNTVDGCGSDTYDWDSTLFYVDCRGVNAVSHNVFRNAKAGGARQTMELHGANMTADGNWQDGWEYGPMFTDSTTVDSGMDNVRAVNNTVLDASSAVSLWPTYRSTGLGGSDILVAGNTSTLNHGRFASRTETDVMAPFPRRALAMVELGGEGENRGALDGLVIRDNTADFFNIVDAAPLTDQYTAVISMITVKSLRGGWHTRHRYLRNVATNLPTMFFRGYVAAPASEGWRDLVFSGNEAHGVGLAPNQSTLNDKFRVPIYMNGTVDGARVTRNRAYTAAGDPFARVDPAGASVPAWSFGSGQTINGQIDGSGARTNIKIVD